jgi:hypothetical protein
MLPIPADANVFDLAYRLDPSSAEVCQQLDPLLAAKLHSMDELKTVYFHLCYGNTYQSLVETRKRVDAILNDYVNAESNLDWKFLHKFQRWMGEGLRTKLVKKWLTDEEVSVDSVWVGVSIPPDHPECVKALDRYVGMYKLERTQENLGLIEELFLVIKAEKLAEACETLSSGTPAVASILLSRSDVPEDFTVKGLKAISKLSKQKNINIKISFDMLKHLGPRSRLDAMKHLLGIITNCNSKQRELPFHTIPNREDVEFFLFPCSIKYNTEVVELVEHFSKLTGQRR